MHDVSVHLDIAAKRLLDLSQVNIEGIVDFIHSYVLEHTHCRPWQGGIIGSHWSRNLWHCLCCFMAGLPSSR